MRATSFLKVLRISCRLLKLGKKYRKFFFYLEIIAFELFGLDTRFTEREYFSSGVNMLTNIFKISDTTKTEFLERISFQSDQKSWQRYCRADLSSVSDTLTCGLSIIVLTRGFLGI